MWDVRDIESLVCQIFILMSNPISTTKVVANHLLKTFKAYDWGQ